MDSAGRSTTNPAGRLFLVRHGESGWNRERLIQGQSPAAPGLTQAGREHAAEAARYLSGSGASLVLSSDLLRARQTAAPIAARLGAPVRLEPRLRERAFGTAQGRPSDQADLRELGFADELVTDPDASPAGGESLRQLHERICGLLGELLTDGPDRRIVLVTHGGPVRVARAYLAGLGAGKMPWPPVLNGSVLEIGPEDVTPRDRTGPLKCS
jgi:2,3-bisphosphoglycerate-dependent phosphoglycerate mutase